MSFLLSCFCIFVPPYNIAKANHYLSTFQIRLMLADSAHNRVFQIDLTDCIVVQYNVVNAPLRKRFLVAIDSDGLSLFMARQGERPKELGSRSFAMLRFFAFGGSFPLYSRKSI
jgi:hypothetical protein